MQICLHQLSENIGNITRNENKYQTNQPPPPRRTKIKQQQQQKQTNKQTKHTSGFAWAFKLEKSHVYGTAD